MQGNNLERQLLERQLLVRQLLVRHLLVRHLLVRHLLVRLHENGVVVELALGINPGALFGRLGNRRRLVRRAIGVIQVATTALRIS